MHNVLLSTWNPHRYTLGSKVQMANSISTFPTRVLNDKQPTDLCIFSKDFKSLYLSKLTWFFHNQARGRCNNTCQYKYIFHHHCHYWVINTCHTLHCVAFFCKQADMKDYQLNRECVKCVTGIKWKMRCTF